MKRALDLGSNFACRFLSNFSKRTFTINDQIKIINDFLNVSFMRHSFFCLDVDFKVKFISSQMRQCEPWKNASDAEFDNAMEGMEKLVMNQLYQYTFTPAIAQDINPATGLPRRVISVDDLERDRILSQRIALFGWIQEEHLDIPTEEGSAGFLMFAEQGMSRNIVHSDSQVIDYHIIPELLKLNHYKAPRDKLICILNCCKVIFGLPRLPYSPLVRPSMPLTQ
jgi:Rab5 GDP/GTP exchange factor